MTGPEPNSVVLIRPDTLGDLVLFSPTLRCLREAWPKARLSVLVRSPYLELARLLAPGLEWIGTDLNVFNQGPATSAEELERVREEVRRRDPDLVVGACSRRNWLEGAMAAATPKARHVVLGRKGEDPFFGFELRQLLGGTPPTEEEAPYSPLARDWERNFGLAEHLLGRAIEPAPPSLQPDPESLGEADRLIRGLKLEPGAFIACAAAGFAHVRIKTWPADRYAATLGWAHRTHGVRTLLVGDESERRHLELIAEEAGSGAARVWTGGAEKLALLAALIARSRFYFGNDTGAMHLAAALGKPVVAIFGGGTWPRFQPAARRAIVFVHPLPCFGCGWDCAFADAPCVKAVGTREVEAGLAQAMAAGDEAFYHIRAVRNLPDPMIDLMGRAGALYRLRAAELQARGKKLEEAAAEGKALRQVCDERLELIDHLGEEAKDRLEVIHRLEADLKRAWSEAEGREELIAALKRKLEEKRV